LCDHSDEWNCFVTLKDSQIQARLSNVEYGPVCADNWSDEWSQETCQQMNFLGVNENSVIQKPMDSDQYFSINTTLSVDDIYTVQDARSNYDESCENAIDFECESFECGKWNLSSSLAAKLAGETGDRFSTAGERWPSLAYLINTKDRTTCTASIIGPRWVVVAHSCITKSDLDVHNWAVIGGIDNSNQIGAVIRIVSHPLAAKVRGFYHKDITLVQMATSFQFDEFVQPICVGEVEPRVGDLCLIAGWSDTPSEGVSFQQYLEHIPVPFVDKDLCNSSAHYNGHLGLSDICTGSRTDRPVCKADNGAPLMCLDPSGYWKLMGIQSKEGECLTKSHPDVFASISAVNDWISKTVR